MVNEAGMHALEPMAFQIWPAKYLHHLAGHLPQLSHQHSARLSWLSLAEPFTAPGESYAGIYVPMLAREVVDGNKRGQKPHIKIKVGNQMRYGTHLMLICIISCSCNDQLALLLGAQ